MKTEVSLPCSHDPAIGPHPESGGSSPHTVSLRSILMLSSHLRLGLYGFSDRNFVVISHLYCPCYMIRPSRHP